MHQTAFEMRRGLWREIRPRLAERVQIGTTVHWRPRAGTGPAPAHEHGRARWAPAPPLEANPAVLHDLSMTGARLLVPADDVIVPGAVIELQLEDEWAAVQVVWVDPSEHPSARWCGVSFVAPEALFLAAVWRLTGRPSGRPPSLSWEQDGTAAADDDPGV